MFAPADRSRIRDAMVDDARDDADVTAAALVGSAARGTEDAWSDISFWPHDQFRATEAGFQMLFGTANAPTSAVDLNIDQAIGMGWLCALHARSALARQKLWQAVIMLDELRNQIIALACLRHGLNPWHGREVDQLPSGELAAFARARTQEMSVPAIQNSQRQLIDLFLAEVELADPSRAARLREPLTTLVQDER